MDALVHARVDYGQGLRAPNQTLRTPIGQAASVSLCDPPADVRKRHNLPDGPLHVVSVWGMGGDNIGLWLASWPANVPGRIYPVPGVPRDEAQTWLVGPRTEAGS